MIGCHYDWVNNRPAGAVLPRAYTCQTPRWSLVAGHASAADNKTNCTVLAYNASPHSSLADSTGTAVSSAEVHTGTRPASTSPWTVDSQLGADVAIAGHTRTSQDALAAANWVEQQRTKYHTSIWIRPLLNTDCDYVPSN